MYPGPWYNYLDSKFLRKIVCIIMLYFAFCEGAARYRHVNILYTSGLLYNFISMKHLLYVLHIYYYISLFCLFVYHVVSYCILCNIMLFQCNRLV